MHDVFTFTSSALPEGTRVVGFRGAEALSTPYELDLFLTMASEEGRELDLSDAIGARATLTLDREDGRPPQRFHGVLADVELLHELGERALVRATLVPQLWQLGLTLHSRVFTDQTIPDILKTVLEEAGLTSDDYVLNLSQTYRPQEHVCQYQESHLDFISRWMEREGIYYYFEQTESRERLIITDNRSFHDKLVPDPVRYFPVTGADVTAKEHLDTFTCRHRSLPAHVRLRDYDYTKPTLDLSARERVSRTGLGEVRTHAGRFFTPDEGKRLAVVRAEELRARQVVYRGAGTTFHLRPGYTFKLTDHPRASFDIAYLTVALEHHGNQAASTPELRRLTGLEGDDVYRVELTAIPETVQFRPERRTPWPRVYGHEAAVVDGELDSDYAQIDDHGRYRVKIQFDESDLRDGKASTWVRMLQPHGGTIEGWHFPLRKGTEVLLTFLGGDPDRPVIAGVVPNTLTPSPVTRANHTTNVIQTGARNRMELEDKAGAERITLSTPYANTMIRMGSPNEEHEFIVRTDSNALLDTGANWDVVVKGKLDERVHGDVSEKYLASKNELVPSGHVTEEYQGQTTTVHTSRNEIYAKQDTLVKDLHKETIGVHEVTITGGGRKEDITGGLTQTIHGDANVTTDGFYSVSAGQKKIVVNGSKSSITYGGTIDLYFGTKLSTFLGVQTSVNVSESTLIALGASQTLRVAAEQLVVVGPSTSFYSGSKLACTAGTAINITSAATVNLKTTTVDQGSTELKSVAAAKLTKAPVHIGNYGTLIFA